MFRAFLYLTRHIQTMVEAMKGQRPNLSNPKLPRDGTDPTSLKFVELASKRACHRMWQPYTITFRWDGWSDSSTSVRAFNGTP